MSRDLRARALRARRLAVDRALRPLDHRLRARLEPLEERLAAGWAAPAGPASPPAPDDPPVAGPELHHALRTGELSRMPRDGVRTLLSAGCAGRWYFDWISEHYGDVERHIGVEWYSPEPADLPANVRWIANTVGDMTDVADGEVDLVFSGQNLEHLSPADVVAFLCEAQRVLRPGGHLVVDSPNRLVTARYGWSHPEHTIELTPDEVSELATLAGFDVRVVRGMWRCVRADGSVYPFDTHDPREQLLRTQSGVDEPDAAFLWWLEAERADRVPDPAAMTDRLREIYAVAWPEACNRLLSAIGQPEDREGEPWVRVGAHESGPAVWGPSTALVPGDWRVTFRTELTDAAAADDTRVCTLVVGVPDEAPLASVTRTAGEIRARPEHTLEFTTGPDFVMGVQFRVEVVGGTALDVRRAVDVSLPMI